MLQQVAQLASPAPQDRRFGTGDVMSGGDVSQAGGFDFSAMLAQAEAEEPLTPNGELAPAEIATEHGMSDPTAGVMAGFPPAMAVSILLDEAVQAASHEGVELFDGIPLAGEKLGESRIDLMSDPQPRPASAAPPIAPALPAMAMREADSVSPRTPGTQPDPASGAPPIAPVLPAMAMREADSVSPPTPGALPDPESAAPQNAPDLPVMVMQQAGSASPRTPGTQPDPASGAPPIAPVLPAMAMQQGGGASLPALSAAAQPGLVPEQPASSTPGFPPQQEVPPSDLFPVAVGLAAMGRDAAPAAAAASAVKLPAGDLAGTDRPVAAQASDAYPEAGEHAAPQGPAEDAAANSVVRSEPPVAQPTGQAPMLMAGPLLPEGRGLSLPVDPLLAGAGSLPAHPGPGPSSSPAATGLALPYQRLFPSQLSAQVAPAVLTMGILPGADGGPGRLTLAIRPAELGTLQIIAEKTEDRTARIAVLAERPETLQLLVRDAPTLEAALRAAGVGEGGGLSLTFGLASQEQGHRGEDARGEAGGDAGRGDGAAPKPSVIAAAHVMARTSLVDLSL
jgi:flagellar hook-length control protein FliK